MERIRINFACATLMHHPYKEQFWTYVVHEDTGEKIHFPKLVLTIYTCFTVLTVSKKTCYRSKILIYWY